MRGAPARGCALLASALAIFLAGCVPQHAGTAHPAISFQPAEVRVSFDKRGITSSSARGVADRATRRAVTIDDPVRIASVSKLVVAMGVMQLVEDGVLNLDRDVSEWLGWHLRNPAFPDTPITLRQLLSHTSGLRDGVDYTTPYGSGTTQSVASDLKAWDTRHAPGTYFTYSNLNFPVIAAVMERATSERFDVLMKRLVFEPLDIDACFNWTTCSDTKIARHVVLYRASGEVARDDLKSKRPDCPVFTQSSCDLSIYKLGDNGALFSPQGGLRISMRDLAKIGRLLMTGTGSKMPVPVIEKLLQPVWTYNGTNGDTEKGFYCTYGLAVTTLATRVKGCADDLFGDGTRRVGHAGEAYGLRSGLWVDLRTGKGVAFFTTAVPDDMYDGKHSRYTRGEERLATGR